MVSWEAYFGYYGNDVSSVSTTVDTTKNGKTTAVTTTTTTDSTILNDMVGVALSGVLIGAALNSEDDDPFYPPSSANSNGDSADVCGQHVNNLGAMHYHFMPQCLSTGNTTLYSASSVSNYNITSTVNRTYTGL